MILIIIIVTIIIIIIVELDVRASRAACDTAAAWFHGALAAAKAWAR